ncbi:ATP-binding protein [Paenirhodobacter hankyongi]|uniref:ATP-binding protein n=1 Tax=Paenirhodobacter hankyongi TaxID=2294033 RepID=A0A421BVD5_9RHOB|nr:ATP-binding protein [Sinirhodobacter hankyongi]RLL72245.1 ATP-binding protein [Sinirhodobacter hankyongi]
MQVERSSHPAPRPDPSAPDREGFRHSFCADPLSVRAALRTTLARFIRQMTEEEAGTLEIVLAEVFNNIVKHGYGDSGKGTITIALSRDPRGLSCLVSDEGIALPDRCLSGIGDHPRPVPDTLPEGGFGWFLIRDLVEDLQYSRHDGRNELVFHLPLAPLALAP